MRTGDDLVNEKTGDQSQVLQRIQVHLHLIIHVHVPNVQDRDLEIAIEEDDHDPDQDQKIEKPIDGLKMATKN